ncbi:MAG: DotI/IcmL/TraM family protein [Gammaproteobacteria bacterium]|nr:DotI/IcmL/TraM family protein [Gammaproteobacteria bacterium]
MAGDELQVVRLRNEFYRDGFYKVIIAFAMILIAIFMLGGISVYLFLQKPAPVSFVTDNEWRAFPPVPLDQPYKKAPDLLQWVNDVLPSLFTYDFISYKSEQSKLREYFTDDGWKKLNALLATYANVNVIQSAKLFVNSEATGSPVIVNQGLLAGRYGWWVQMPIVIHYSNVERHYDSSLVLQALVVRTSTLDNLSGIAIDNLIEVKPPAPQTKVQQVTVQPTTQTGLPGVGQPGQGQVGPVQQDQGQQDQGQQDQGGSVGANG